MRPRSCEPVEADRARKVGVLCELLVQFGERVTRDSTEDYDRGEKLDHYRRVPSLEAVVIVSHREPRVEVWSRAPGAQVWDRAEARAGQAAAVPALGCVLDVDAIWRAAAEPG